MLYKVCFQAIEFISGHGGLALNPTSSPTKGDSLSLKQASSMLVMSGGEGYIDFRIGRGMKTLRFQSLYGGMYILQLI